MAKALSGWEMSWGVFHHTRLSRLAGRCVVFKLLERVRKGRGNPRPLRTQLQVQRDLWRGLGHCCALWDVGLILFDWLRHVIVSSEDAFERMRAFKIDFDRKKIKPELKMSGRLVLAVWCWDLHEIVSGMNVFVSTWNLLIKCHFHNNWNLFSLVTKERSNEQIGCSVIIWELSPNIRMIIA